WRAVRRWGSVSAARGERQHDDRNAFIHLQFHTRRISSTALLCRSSVFGVRITDSAPTVIPVKAGSKRSKRASPILPSPKRGKGIPAFAGITTLQSVR